MKLSLLAAGGGIIAVVALSACSHKRPGFDRPPGETRPEIRHQMENKIAARDLNQDGALTCEDIDLGRAQLFAKVDEDSNGALDEAEYANLMWHDKLYVLLNLANDDRDGDGAVSLPELQARGDPFFTRVDSDRNCVITMEEMRFVMQGPGKTEGPPPGGKRRRVEGGAPG